jgi:hypothetical protein
LPHQWQQNFYHRRSTAPFFSLFIYFLSLLFLSALILSQNSLSHPNLLRLFSRFALSFPLDGVALLFFFFSAHSLKTLSASLYSAILPFLFAPGSLTPPLAIPLSLSRFSHLETCPSRVCAAPLPSSVLSPQAIDCLADPLSWPRHPYPFVFHHLTFPPSFSL